MRRAGPATVETPRGGPAVYDRSGTAAECRPDAEGALAEDERPEGGVRRAAGAAPGPAPRLHLFAGARPGRRRRPVPADQPGPLGQVRPVRPVAELRGLGLRRGPVRGPELPAGPEPRPALFQRRAEPGPDRGPGGAGAGAPGGAADGAGGLHEEAARIGTRTCWRPATAGRAGVREVARRRGRSPQSIHNSLRRIRRALFECVRPIARARGAWHERRRTRRSPRRVPRPGRRRTARGSSTSRGPAGSRPYLLDEPGGASLFRRVLPAPHRDPLRGPRRAGGRRRAGAAGLARTTRPPGAGGGDRPRRHAAVVGARPVDGPGGPGRDGRGGAGLAGDRAAAGLRRRRPRRPPAGEPAEENVAWLVNAQDCLWDDAGPAARAATCAPARTCT